jgi:RimJ/RimL family protein N-acetyltransferase
MRNAWLQQDFSPVLRDDDHNLKPPERIAAGAVVLRRYTPSDIDILQTTIQENLDHLRPWMPWAQEPPTRAVLVVDFIADQSWEAGTDFNYGIWNKDEQELRGGCGLHARIGPGAIEIGYWVSHKHIGRGYAKAAAYALTHAALSLPGITRVEIHCDEANVRSAAVPRALGYRLDRVVEDEIKAPGEVGREMLWVFEETHSTVAARVTNLDHL